ncbi:hypothetical protein CMV_010962 [Castanea mollissima]|uniref:Uncharacterized protein n=1 Tax=Castanea mollissima TaxID=60419 RepID=A0A8J4RHI9_9ROSI|nr:hypothetical protein CMV_010962 [Castanea mollissima]
MDNNNNNNNNNSNNNHSALQEGNERELHFFTGLLEAFSLLFGFLLTLLGWKFYNAVKEFFYQFQTSLLGNSLIFVTGFDMVLS